MAKRVLHICDIAQALSSDLRRQIDIVNRALPNNHRKRGRPPLLKPRAYNMEKKQGRMTVRECLQDMLARLEIADHLCSKNECHHALGMARTIRFELRVITDIVFEIG